MNTSRVLEELRSLLRVLNRGIGVAIFVEQEIYKPLEARGLSRRDIRDIILILAAQGMVEEWTKRPDLPNYFEDMVVLPAGLLWLNQEEDNEDQSLVVEGFKSEQVP